MTASPALALALVLFGPTVPPPVGEAPSKAPAPAPALAPAAAPAQPKAPAPAPAPTPAPAAARPTVSAPAPATTPPPAADAQTSFEAAGRGAVRTRDIATLLSSFIEQCETEKREIERARCHATTAFLRRTLPRQTFAFTSDDPSVVAVSDYDASIRGYHVALAGCVACDKPVTIGRASEPRFVTLKAPDKDADSLVKAVAISRNTFGFDTLAEAKRWLDAERPFLRAEFLFQPQIVGDAWTFRSNRGIALKFVGARVYNRCTGDVLLSKPPSTTMADRPGPGHEDPTCAVKPAVADAAAQSAPPPDARPMQLSKTLIADAMAKIRPQVFACYQQFKVPGMVELAFVVAGNGTVQAVSVAPAWRGTPTGACVKEAAKDAHFQPFQLDEQKFTYPFFLRQ